MRCPPTTCWPIRVRVRVRVRVRDALPSYDLLANAGDHLRDVDGASFGATPLHDARGVEVMEALDARVTRLTTNIAQTTLDLSLQRRLP